MSRLLILEDEPEMAQALLDLLGKSYQVSYAADLATAKKLLTTNEFDLLILDVSLPDGSGFDLCEFIANGIVSEGVRVQTSRKVPVIFLTGNSDLENRMKGLELGAQDYILKPFYNKELILRIEMRLREFENQSDTIICGDLKIEKDQQRVFLVRPEQPDEEINLTPHEYKILFLLIANKNQVVLRTKIVESIWGSGYNLSDKAVNSHISNLRKKIQSKLCKITASADKGYFLNIL